MEAVAVGEVAQTGAHVVGDGAGEGDGQADAQDGVGEGERVEIAVAQEEKAGDQSPDQRDWGEDRAGEVGEGEDGGG